MVSNLGTARSLGRRPRIDSRAAISAAVKFRVFLRAAQLAHPATFAIGPTPSKGLGFVPEDLEQLDDAFELPVAEQGTVLCQFDEHA